MRVLILTQLYAPETGALPNRLEPFVRHLVGSGHQVFVATGMPNYPTGVVFREYRRKLFYSEERDGASILRTAFYTVPRNQSRYSQLVSYMSFLPAVFCSAVRAGKPDVIVVTSPPLFPAAVGAILARMWRCKLLLDLRDLWPDEIVACGGALETSLLVRAVRSLERQAYSRADCICCTTLAFQHTVVQRGAPNERTVLLPNGADIELFTPHPRDNPIANAMNLGDRIAVMYTGTLGIKHGLDAVLRAAALLRSYRNIVFVFIGAGAREELLHACAKQFGLSNVVFLGERPVKDIPKLLARADMCISSLLPALYLEKIISVKIFEYMACERPVIAAQTGESARVVADAAAGLVVPPGDAEAIASAILTLCDNPQLRTAMGRAGRQYVTQNYARAVLAKRFEAILQTVCGQKTINVSEIDLSIPATHSARTVENQAEVDAA